MLSTQLVSWRPRPRKLSRNEDYALVWTSDRLRGRPVSIQIAIAGQERTVSWFALGRGSTGPLRSKKLLDESGRRGEEEGVVPATAPEDL
jgi:hypothetical protein